MLLCRQPVTELLQCLTISKKKGNIRKIFLNNIFHYSVFFNAFAANDCAGFSLNNNNKCAQGRKIAHYFNCKAI